MLLELFLNFMWLVFYTFKMIIKYLKDKITFTCIYCHSYVVPEYSAYMIMYKKGGGVILEISSLAYNIIHGMVSKQNVYIYIYM